MDEASGAHNRLTVARRRYHLAYRRFHDSIGAIDRLFLRWQEQPPPPDEMRELRTGQ